MLKRTIDKITYVFGLIVIVFIPFQTLVQNILERRFSSGTSFWLAHFYEPVLIVLLLLLIATNLNPITFRSKDRLLAGFSLVFGLISIFFFASSISRGIEGFRFDFIGLAFFFLYSFLNFSVGQRQRAITVYLSVAIFASIWAVTERFLPLHYWSLFGLNNFGWGTFAVVKVYQSSAFLPGPNQLGSFLLPALFLLLANRPKIGKAKSYKIIRVILAFLVATAIILSFSRAAFVGAAIGLVSYAVFVEKKWPRKIAYLSVIVLLAIGLLYAYRHGSVQTRDLFSHGLSGTQHMTALKNSTDEFKSRFSEPSALIFGSGIGDAGPAVLKYGSGFISESWYIQLLLELGIVGLLLWLCFIFVILLRLNQSKNYGLFLALISVSGAAIFLHTWADNPALAITLFILIGSRNYENPN